MAEKGRYFTFLVYEESAKDGWIDELKRTHGDYAISPLHEPDGEEKKSHYHVVYRHSNTISLEGAKKAIPAGIAANGHVEMVSAPRNLQRYLIHLDDPDKQQFSGPKEITIINNFPLDLTRDFSKAELADQRRRVFDAIREFNVFEYSDLLDYLGEYDLDLFDYAANHTILFNTYLTSKRNKYESMDDAD